MKQDYLYNHRKNNGRKIYDWERKLWESESPQLINALNVLENRITPILASISQYLPNLTDHTINHVNKLRELTDHFIDKDELSVAEIYCLNVAYLIHDACLSPDVYQDDIEDNDEEKDNDKDGIAVIRDDEFYERLCVQHLRNIEKPTTIEAIEELKNGFKEDFEKTGYKTDFILFSFLRWKHGEKAKSVLIDFKLGKKGQEQYLIDNDDLREATCAIVGPIAESHSLPFEEIIKLGDERQFPRDGFINDYDDATVRPQFLAIILRIVDACQIDSSRALTWKRLLQKPTGDSEGHWDFQGRLSLSFDKDSGILKFNLREQNTPIEEAPIWWKAYEYIHDIVAPEMDAGTKQNKLKKYTTLKYTNIAGADSPKEFQTINPTKEWEPVDVKPKISNPNEIIRSIGGDTLYGKDPVVPIRELLQNALDASDVYDTKVERNEKKPIEIHLENTTIKIRDYGIGMSYKVMTEVLPDFGRSIWSSIDISEHNNDYFNPKLRPRGKFGIGFFSIFMIAREVTVCTNYLYKEIMQDKVLEFKEGIDNRPILRPFNEHEQVRLRDGGTEVSFTLKDKQDLSDFKFSTLLGIKFDLHESIQDINRFATVIKMIAPLANRPIIIKSNNESVRIDPIDIEGLQQNVDEYRERLYGPLDVQEEMDKEFQQQSKKLWEKLKIVTNYKNQTLGLIAPWPLASVHTLLNSPGVVVDGGLRVESTYHFCGICNGSVSKADRLKARTDLSEISDESKTKFIENYLDLYRNPNTNKYWATISNDHKRIKDGMVSELCFYNPEILGILFSIDPTNLKKKGDKDDWCKILKKKGKVIFFIPNDDIQTINFEILFKKEAFCIPNLSIWSKPSFIAKEILGSDDNHEISISNTLKKYFANKTNLNIEMKYGRFVIATAPGAKQVNFNANGIIYYDPKRHAPEDSKDEDADAFEDLVLLSERYGKNIINLVNG